MCQVAANGRLSPKENITIAASPRKQQKKKQQPSGTQGKHMEELRYNGLTL